MNTVDRHYRLSKAAYSIVAARDKDRFPTEKDFVSEAILSYGENAELEDMSRMLKEINKKIDRIIKAMGW